MDAELFPILEFFKYCFLSYQGLFAARNQTKMNFFKSINIQNFMSLKDLLMLLIVYFLKIL